MSTQEEESGIRALFEKFREIDQRGAPSFAKTLEGRSRLDSPGWFAWALHHRTALAAFFLIAVLAAILVPWSSRPTPAQIEVAAVQMLTWEAPTDFLLESEDEFLSAVPGIDPETLILEVAVTPGESAGGSIPFEAWGKP